jgi:hypothetical protein
MLFLVLDCSGPMGRVEIEEYSGKWLFIFFGLTSIWTQGFALAKQVLYHLSHTSKSIYFALVILEMGSWELLAQTGLEPHSSRFSLPSN